MPFVFYHGAARWRVPDEFVALVDAEKGWTRYLLNFRFTVLDLGKIDDHALSRQPRLRAWLLVAKYATRDSQQLGAKDTLAEVLLGAAEDFPFLLRYVMETFRSYDERTLREIIRRVRPEEEEKMMSQFAQEIIAKGKPEWLRQGRQEGRQEGRREEAASFLLRLLQRRFGPLPGAVTEKVRSSD